MGRLLSPLIVTASILVGLSMLGPTAMATDSFDHSYRTYADLLSDHVVDDRIDYAKLKANREALDDIVKQLSRSTDSMLKSWSREDQIAYWINAYNVFTLQAIVDHYPIEWRWLNLLTLTPRNSIKQIAGVWTELRWTAAGNQRTLDQIEHETLRPLYSEPRIHFAINCASVSCPPLNSKPYVGERLDRQLSLAAHNYLSSEFGLQVDGTTLQVSRIFDWYGDDFIDGYAHLVDGGSNKEQAILGVIVAYGTSEASRVARSGTATVQHLRYDWSLNDTATR